MMDPDDYNHAFHEDAQPGDLAAIVNLSDICSKTRDPHDGKPEAVPFVVEGT